MRAATGPVVVDSSPLVAFLYLLMRDEVVSGAVERIAEEVGEDERDRRFTNGWLGAHAKDLAARLTRP